MKLISEDLQTIMAINYNLDSNVSASRILSITTPDKKVYFFYMWNEYNKQIKVFVHKNIDGAKVLLTFQFHGQIVEKSFKISKPIKVNKIINFINQILSYYELETKSSDFK